MPSMPERPLVSVIIPSYNQGRFIRETIDSVLSQDYRPIEVLVFDGASKDETVSVLKSYDAPELQWWSEPDRGVVDAVNKGLARARGDIVAIQSSDDVYVPGAISRPFRRCFNRRSWGWSTATSSTSMPNRASEDGRISLPSRCTSTSAS